MCPLHTKIGGIHEILTSQNYDLTKDPVHRPTRSFFEKGWVQAFRIGIWERKPAWDSGSEFGVRFRIWGFGASGPRLKAEDGDRSGSGSGLQGSVCCIVSLCSRNRPAQRLIGLHRTRQFLVVCQNSGLAPRHHAPFQHILSKSTSLDSRTRCRRSSCSCHCYCCCCIRL